MAAKERLNPEITLKKEHAARMVQLEFQRAWKGADPQPLKVEDL